VVAQRTIRYGIIGFGRFAERAIAPAIRRARNSAVIALQKRSPEAARKKADECSIPLAFASAGELVAHPDIDAVFIASANSAHCPETLAAAAAGKHVIVEKPMALDAREAERMIAACREAGVHLMVGHMVRLSPVVRRAADLIRTGRVGTVKSVRAEFMYDARISSRTWLLDRAVAGGGPVYDIGVHCIDTLRYLLGGEPSDVTGRLSPAPTDVATEESAILAMRFPGGVLASVHRGRLTLTRGKADRPFAPEVEEMDVPNLYVEEISMFTDWLLGGSEPEINGANGLSNQIVLDSALSVEKEKP